MIGSGHTPLGKAVFRRGILVMRPLVDRKLKRGIATFLSWLLHGAAPGRLQQSCLWFFPMVGLTSLFLQV